MAETWSCKLPDFDLISPNRLYRMHFAQRGRYKRQLESMLFAYGDKIEEIESPVEVKITRYYGYRKRQMDEDNLYGACKALIDAIRVRNKGKSGGLGIIKDDSPKHMKLDVQQKKSPEKESFVEITVKHLPS